MKTLILIFILFFNTCIISNANGLYLNEIMASNKSTYADEEGKYEDWIEIYNATDKDVNLEGYLLTDDPDEPKKWKFPAGAVIEAKGFIIVWADKDTLDEGLHANFNLKKDGEYLALYAPNAFMQLDKIKFPALESDFSYARTIDGAGEWVVTSNPTPNQSNKGSSVPGEHVLNIYPFPNPSNDVLKLNFENFSEPFLNLSVIDINGKEYKTPFIISEGIIEIDIQDLTSGTYIININNKRYSYTGKFIKQ